MFSTAFIFYLFYYKSVILFTSYFIWIRVCYVIYTWHLIYIIRESKNCWIFSTINPTIKRLIDSTVYRNRVKQNKNSVIPAICGWFNVTKLCYMDPAIFASRYIGTTFSDCCVIRRLNVFMTGNIRKNKLLFHRKVSISVRICDNWPSYYDDSNPVSRVR